MTMEQAAPRDSQTQSQLLVRLFLSIGVLPILLAVALVLLLIAVASLAPVGHTAVPDGQAAIDATRTVG